MGVEGRFPTKPPLGEDGRDLKAHRCRKKNNEEVEGFISQSSGNQVQLFSWYKTLEFSLAAFQDLMIVPQSSFDPLRRESNWDGCVFKTKWFRYFCIWRAEARDLATERGVGWICAGCSNDSIFLILVVIFIILGDKVQLPEFPSTGSGPRERSSWEVLEKKARPIVAMDKSRAIQMR